jgi:hypothetical protein
LREPNFGEYETGAIYYGLESGIFRGNKKRSSNFPWQQVGSGVVNPGDYRFILPSKIFYVLGAPTRTKSSTLLIFP